MRKFYIQFVKITKAHVLRALPNKYICKMVDGGGDGHDGIVFVWWALLLIPGQHILHTLEPASILFHAQSDITISFQNGFYICGYSCVLSRHNAGPIIGYACTDQIEPNEKTKCRVKIKKAHRRNEENRIGSDKMTRRKL